VRGSAAALISLLTVGVTTACSSTVGGHPTVGDSVIARAPERGDCWDVTKPGPTSALDDETRVPCSGAHDEETVWVDDGVLDAAAPYPTVANLAGPDDPIGKAVDDVCGYGMVEAYLGIDITLDVPPYGLYVSTAPRLPNRAEWAAGARWVRCDVVFGIESGEPAPGKMAGALKGPQAAAYHLCLTGTWDAYDLASCAQPHDAEAFQPFQLDYLTPWPGDARSRQDLTQSCADGLPYALTANGLPDGFRLDVFVGPPDGWEATRLVACVLVPTAGGQTSTTFLD
jgi:hypothetical protein